MIRLLLSVPFIMAYELLPNLKCELPKYFQPCKSINQRLLGITENVFETLRQNGLHVGLNISNNSICSEEYTHYGQMIYNPTGSTSTTDLLFKNSIVYTPNTAYNIILHETLHSLGLDHNKGEFGMMNYAVSENWYGGISNDERKLWLSIDDIRGITKNCYP
jgi:hypothetical protein